MARAAAAGPPADHAWLSVTARIRGGTIGKAPG